MLHAIKIAPSEPHVARVVCSGEFEDGTAGNATGGQLTEAIATWLEAHPDLAIRELDVDFREVSYTFGNAPTSSFFPLLRFGISAVRIRPSAQSRASLESLVSAGNVEFLIRILSEEKSQP